MSLKISRHRIRRLLVSACIPVCVFLFWHGGAGAEQSVLLHDSLFALQSQIQGYRDRIAEGTEKIRTLKDASLVIEDRRKKLALELALARLMLEKSEKELTRLNGEIEIRSGQIGRERTVLSQLLRDIARDEYAAPGQLLLEKGVRRRLEDVAHIAFLHNGLFETTRDVRIRQKALAAEKNKLAQEHKQIALLHEVSLRQTRDLYEELERKKALEAYAGARAAAFEQLLKRSELKSFSLQEEFFRQEGVGKRLSLAEAFGHADGVARRVGIRPALLLALVTQESQLGEMQGTGTWKNDMHPSQWASFITVMQRLGLNPDLVPVSKKPAYGWGGALGPAQFLSSTWLGYEARVTELTGHTVPSPWNIDDAFAASALKLAQAGAMQKTEGAERKAALMYFAGENWDNPAFEFYADSVLELARGIEKELNL